MEPVLSILMPVYDERATVARAVEEAVHADLGVRFEVIVVDDGSTDGTGDVLAGGEWPAERVRVLRHDRNRGKGAAVRTALEAARGEFAAVLDADLEYRAADVAVLLRPLLAGEANAAFGVRGGEGRPSSSLYAVGSRVVNLAGNLLYGAHLHDAMTCLKAIRTDVFRDLRLSRNGFDIEAEITARLLRRGERIVEVPVSYHARSSDEGKKLTAVDGVRVLATLLRCRFTR